MTLEGIAPAYANYRANQITSAKRCVEEGGGVWQGVQEANQPSGDVALFGSPKTKTTLAIKLTEITPELVRSKLKSSDAEWAQ